MSNVSFPCHYDKDGKGGASVGFNIFDTCSHMKMFLTKIFKSNQIMLNALTTIIYQSHFMQVFLIFSYLNSLSIISSYTDLFPCADLSRCFLRTAAVRSDGVGSVVRSKGVRP